MIDVREIRVGNYFDYQNEFCVVKLIDADFDDDDLGMFYCDTHIGDHLIGNSRQKSFTPIYITEDILINLGFALHQVFENQKYFVIEGFNIHDYGYGICMDKNKFNLCYISKLSIFPAITKKKISYIHQIQNLFSDLENVSLQLTNKSYKVKE